jgi:hypothetical protein
MSSNVCPLCMFGSTWGGCVYVCVGVTVKAYNNLKSKIKNKAHIHTYPYTPLHTQIYTHTHSYTPTCLKVGISPSSTFCSAF